MKSGLLSLFLALCLLAVSSSARATSLNFTYPTNDATLDGAIVVYAQGSSDLWWTQLQADGLAVSTSGPNGSYLWNTTSVPNGWHTLTVRGFQEWASSPSVSATVNVYVQNTGNGQLYFATYGPHTPLPDESWCAAVIPTSPEKIQANSWYNHTMPTSGQLDGYYANEPSWVGKSYMDRVDGQYIGSTDMIIRWAACKWGIDENVARAAVWGESSGQQLATGDWTTDTSECPPFGASWSGSSCAATYGMSQIRYTNMHGTWPMSHNSSAFNVDFRFAMLRACMDGQNNLFYGEQPAAGYPTYPNGNANQMLWGCIQSWYSGAWYDANGLWYIGYIQGEVADQRWLN